MNRPQCLGKELVDILPMVGSYECAPVDNGSQEDTTPGNCVMFECDVSVLVVVVLSFSEPVNMGARIGSTSLEAVGRPVAKPSTSDPITITHDYQSAPVRIVALCLRLAALLVNTGGTSSPRVRCPLKTEALQDD